MNRKKWTKEEDDILVKYYATEGTDVTSRLSDRTVNAVKNRAQALGLICRQTMFGWTAEELEILHKYYPSEGKRVANRLPGRTVKTIQIMAFREGVKRQFHH